METLGQLLKTKLKVYSSYVASAIAILLIVSLIGNIRKSLKVKERINEEQEKVISLERKKEELEKELARTTSEEYAEKQLRDKLGLAKEGEVVVVLPDAEILAKIASKGEEEEEILPKANWQKWFDLFF